MIPQRVELSGFLCYKEKQAVSFDGASLWMLAGLNGSGKSSIFDAVTYALFGHHRGGASDAYELINKDSDRAGILFEFALDGECYQIHRTLQRTKQGKSRATQQIYRRADDNWDAIEGTNYRDGFKEWVQQRIGLTYETFTSSVLLLQGRAEKLLDSAPSGRFQVSASIVDLERYDKLHRRSDEQRKQLDGTVKTIRDQLAAVPEVGPLELIEAEGRIADGTTARQRSQEEVERLQKLEFQAGEWAGLRRRLGEARRRWDEAHALLAERDAIERDLARLRELREVLPRVQTVAEQRGQTAESERKSAELARQKEKLEQQRAEQDESLTDVKQKQEHLHAQITEGEEKQRQINEERLKVGALVEKLKVYEQQENELKRVEDELKRVPPEPEKALSKAKVEHEELARLAQVVRLLARFQALRDELRAATAREKEAAAATKRIHQSGIKLKTEVDRLKLESGGAEQARRQADEEAASARTLHQQADRELQELLTLRGSKVCRACGQPLTPGHVEEEKKRRTGEVAAAEKSSKLAAAAQGAAAGRERETRDASAATEKALQEERERWRGEEAEAKQARKDVERLERDCGQVHGELPDEFRRRVAPAAPLSWLETKYPAEADVAAARAKAAGAEEARQRVEDAEKALRRWSNLNGQRASVTQQLARIQSDLPADREGVRRRHVTLEAEKQSTEKTLQTRRAEVAKLQQEFDQLTREREHTRGGVGELLGRLNTEVATREACRKTLERARKELPAGWQPLADTARLADLNQWSRERDDLVAAQTEDRARRLQEAQGGLEQMRREQEELRQQEGQFPEEARQDVPAIQSRLHDARRAYKTCDEELTQARHDHALLDGRQRQREQLHKDSLKAEEELCQAKLLAELLGRDRLQLHLVRQAERQVVDHANAVLDRLSGGQLFLKLAGEAGGEGQGAKALELEAHNRVTGDKPINVAFLSGSQKFRVAVSLALGIGQYASRQHRPIESVIIDEGFGCLDRNGRAVMIQELQNLRGQLRCILLVSHQEEFADAFNDGYHFELSNGTAVATRFQR